MTRRFRFPFVAQRTPVALALVLSLGMVQQAGAQTAADILTTALERWEASTRDIDNYTVVQDAMGFARTTRFEKRMIDGHPAFVPAGSEDDSGWNDMYRVFPQLAERARLQGEREVDGHATYVLVVNDFSGVELGAETGGRGDFTPKTGVFYIDTDEYLVRGMIMDGEVTADGQTSPFTVEAHMEDYRQVEGMWHPFRIRVITEGMPPGMSEEDFERARQAMAEFDEQLAQVPEAQRPMVEGMLKRQMEQIEKMLASGKYEIVVETRDLRVNE